MPHAYHALRLLGMLLLVLSITAITFAQSPTLQTDKPDYYPGDTVRITGTGWMAGETVELVIEETPEIHHPDTLYAVANANGDIFNDEYIIQDHDLGQSFTLTATGLTSGWTAQTTFTDGITTWNGNTSTDWFTNTNWSSNTPGNNDIAVIPAGAPRYPVITTGNATPGSLIIEVGATVTISGGTFKVSKNNTTTDSVAIRGTLVHNGGDFRPDGNSSTAIAFRVFPGGLYQIGGTNGFFAPHVAGEIVNYTLDANSTVEYNGTTQIISAAPSPYGHLTTSGSGTKTLGGNTNVVGNLTIGTGTTLDVSSTNNSSNVKSLDVGGNWTNNGRLIPRSGTVTLTNSATATLQTISGSTNFNNLTINASSKTKDFGSSVDTINGNLTISSGTMDGGTSLFVFNGSGNLAGANNKNFYDVQINDGVTTMITSGHVTIAHNLVNNGSYTYSAGAIRATILNGSGVQSISGNGTTRFDSLRINNSSGIVTSKDLTIDRSLTFVNGKVSTGSNKVIIASGGNVFGANSDRYIDGKLARVYNATGSKDFPVGKDGSYRPITLNYTALTGTSTVTAENFSSGFPGSAPSGSAQVGDRYWNVTQSGGSGFTYNITLDGSGLSFTGDPRILKRDGGTTVALATTTPNYTATNLTSLSDFALGEVTCTPPGASATGGTITCTNPSVSLQSATETGVNYSWSGPDGFTSSSSSPTVSTSGTYILTVTGSASGCTSTAAAVVDQTTEPPGATANGGTITCTTTSVTLTGGPDGFEYLWTGPNGFSSTQQSPAGVTEIGSYTLRVTDVSNGCTSTAEALVDENVAEPGASATGGTITCTSTSITISGSSTSGNQYLWSGSGIVGADDGLTVNVNSGGIYTFRVTNSENGCTSTATASVGVDQDPPGASATGGNLTCTTTSVQLTGVTDSGNGYSWSGPGSITNPNTLTPTVSVSGTYTLTVTNSTNGCTSTAIAEVTQNTTPPGASATGGQLTCTTTSVQLTGATDSGNQYSWSGPGAITDGNTLTPTVSISGTYTLTVTNSLNGCTSSATAEVSQNTNPPGATANGGTITCTTTSVTLTALPNGFAYSWSRVGGGFSSTAQNPSVTESGSYIVTITDNSNGCTSTAEAIVNQQTDSPGASASGGTLTCTTTNVQLQALPNGMTYSWSRVGGGFSETAQSPTVGTSGTYIVTVTNSNGCTSTAQTVVDENVSEPGATASGGTITCTTTSVTLTAEPDGYSYSWSQVGGGFTSTNRTPSVSTSGTYIVVVMNTANGCTSSAQTVVGQNTTPPGASATGGHLTCTTTSVQLTGATDSGNQYSWSGPGAITDGNTLTPTVSISGTYTLTVTNSLNGCTSSATAEVTQNTNPPGATANGGTITCANTSVTLMAEPDGFSYSWSRVGNGFSSTDRMVAVATSGTYIVTITNTANGCTSSAQTIVNQNSTIPIASASGGTITCTSTCVPLTAADGGIYVSSYTYAWSGPDGFTSAAQNAGCVATSGVYTLTVTNTLNGCTASTTVEVHQDNEPPGASATGGTITCTTTSIQLNALPDGKSYLWNGPSGFTSTLRNPVVSTSGTYELLVTNTSNGCTSTTSTLVDQNTVPPGATATGGTITCASTSITLQAEPTGLTYTYSWSRVGNGFSSSAQNPSVGTSGTYILTVTNTLNGCTSTASAFVDKTSLPTAWRSAGPDSQIVMYGNPITDVSVSGEDAETVGDGLSITWEYKLASAGSYTAGLPDSLSALQTASSGSSGLPGSATWNVSGNIKVSVGVYKIRATITDGDGCTNFVIFTINVIPACVGPIADRMYVGTLFAWTTSPSSSTATLTLSAALKACTLGDIRTAKVTFAIRNGTNWTPISGASNLPVGLIHPDTLTQGTATAIVQYNIGNNDAADLEVAIIVTGNFASNNPAQDALVTVAKPSTTGSIGICGQLDNGTVSRGFVRGADNDITQFSLRVTFNKKGTNAQGKVTIIIHSMNNPDGAPSAELRTYKVTSTAIASLAVDAAKGTASFSSKATLQDITNPSSIVSVDGGATLQVEMVDGYKGTRENPTVKDSISFYLLNKSGGVWYANKLSSALQAVKMQVKDGIGDIIVSGAANKLGTDLVPEEYALDQNYPNPFNPATQIKYALPVESQVKLAVYNMLGQEVKVLVDAIEEEGFREIVLDAHNLPSGVYFYRLTATSTANANDRFMQVRKMLLMK